MNDKQRRAMFAKNGNTARKPRPKPASKPRLGSLENPRVATEEETQAMLRGMANAQGRRLAESVREGPRPVTVKQTQARVRDLGLSAKREDGEWRINFPGGHEGTAYYTEDNDDAYATSEAMVRHLVNAGLNGHVRAKEAIGMRFSHNSERGRVYRVAYKQDGGGLPGREYKIHHVLLEPNGRVDAYQGSRDLTEADARRILEAA